jgi:Asp/Glu/hydantoin racemase
MKAEEIIEVLEDISSEQVGVSHEVWDKWEKRLEEAVYSEMSSCLKYMGDTGRLDSLSSFVIACYDKELIELVLKLVNTPCEHLILDSIERFAKNKERL